MRSIKLTTFIAAICAVSMLASCKKKEDKPSASTISQAVTETVNDTKKEAAPAVEKAKKDATVAVDKAKKDAAPVADKAKADAKKALDNVTK